MKNNCIAFCILISLLLISCATSVTREPINPNDLPEEELVTVVIHRNLFIQKFNNEDVDWPKSNFWFGHIPLNIKIPSGMHTFHVRYNDGKLYTDKYTPTSAILESGNTYLVIGEVQESKSFLNFSGFGPRVLYNIYKYNNKKIGEKVTYDPLNNSHSLLPDALIGKTLIGADEKGTHKLIMKENGSFEYTKNENVYTGTWSFNSEEKRYPYKFEWNENGQQQGYIMDFFGNEILLIWIGSWYITDAYKPFILRLRYE